MLFTTHSLKSGVWCLAILLVLGITIARGGDSAMPTVLFSGNLESGAAWVLEQDATLVKDPENPAGMLRLAVSPKIASAKAKLKAPLPLPGWHWCRLSFLYRMTPGVAPTVTWTQVDAQQIPHSRSSAGRIRLPPCESFTPVQFDFISWPDAATVQLTVDVTGVSGFAGKAEFILKDLQLKVLSAVPELPPQRLERALLNHDFESPNVFGYHNPLGSGAELKVIDGTDAFSGNRFLRHQIPGEKGGSHFFPPLRAGVLFAFGHLYRVSLQARGTGTLGFGLRAGDSSYFDVPSTMMPQLFPLAPEKWRPVTADFIADQKTLTPYDLFMFIGGNVDLDDIQIERLK